ncbi:MAG TPA: VCBS domain-containing protein, partial [Caulobacteraceae bacterium]|nr:VCBS domain-containing protein [Caulobacteraceae bacterium]
TWTYSLDNTDAAVQALGVGDTLQDTITVWSEDGTDSEEITVTINGTNDEATISGDTVGSVTEESSLTATGTLSVADVDTGEDELVPVAAGTAGDNGYGTFEVLADGTWTYSLDNTDAAVQALGAGDTLQDTITVWSEDGTDSEVITVTIHGTNDEATISGDVVGSVTEESNLTATGTLSVADVDTGEDELVPVAAGTAGDNGYGTFEVLADGTWTYSLDNTDAAVQALGVGDTLEDTITVTSEDGTDSEEITVTINGTNDEATISGDVVGSVTEESNLTATGALSVADVDTGEDELVPVAAGTAGDNGYGTFEVLADGTWTYSLDNTDAAVQALGVGDTLQDTITVWSEDGTDSEEITVTINGTNDEATISGDVVGSVTEDTDLSDNGVLTISDVDAGEAELQPLNTAGDNGYGTFTVNADGTWTYALDNTDAAVQALPAGGTLSDTITVWSEDNTDSQVITVTITGTNDAATFGGVNTGSVTEDGTLVASGTATVDDPDNGQDSFQAANLAGAYGSLALLATGAWTYTLNNSDPDLATLDTGETATETFNIQSADGTAHQIVVTVNGANDAGDPNDFDHLVTSTTTVTVNPGAPGTQTIYGSTQNDLIYGGSANDFLYGGAGDDVIQGYGAGGPTTGQDSDEIYGGSGNDTLSGNQQNDVIYGGSGNDKISGNAGADVLWGGTGQDIFVFDSPSDATDTIEDFSVADDTIWLSSSGFGLAAGALSANAFHTGAAAHDADDRIIYNPVTGQVIYDSNGNAGGGSTVLVQLDPGLAITQSDFWVF